MRKTCTISAHKAFVHLNIFGNNFGAGAMLGLGGTAVGHIVAP